jgi:hypothetical protein
MQTHMCQNLLPAWQLKPRSITRALSPTALPLLLHLCVSAGAMGNYSQGMNMNMPMGYGNMGGMGMGQMGMGQMGMGGMVGMNNMGGARKQGGVMGLGDQNGNLQASTGLWGGGGGEGGACSCTCS